MRPGYIIAVAPRTVLPYHHHHNHELTTS